MTSTEELHARFEAAGQGQVLRFWERMDEAERARLVEQLDAVDLALVERLHAQAAAGSTYGAAAPELEPPEVFPLVRDADLEARAEAAAARGREALSAGRVAYMVVAGGQGSRLGYDGPKGCYPIAPLTGRSLFELHAHRLRAARRRHGAPVPWYVMTSPANDADTRAFFESSSWFGLEPDDVFFFSQAMLPALDTEGRILLASESELFLAPNGHGGSLMALQSSGALADMRARGIDTISYFQVDNPLARPADPLFLGLHDLAGAGMSSKVVAKRDADEKVGVLGRIDGRMGCIEYSDLSDELRLATDESGELLFNAGNMALHALSVDFVESLTGSGDLRLPWHVARKRIQTLDGEGVAVEVDGVKFETFVFDALAESADSVTLEVDRGLEFSPVKNPSGQDSADSCREDLCRMFAGWLRAAGIDPPEGTVGPWPALEVDPLFAEDLGEFLERVERGEGEPRRMGGGLLFDDPRGEA